MKSIKSHFYLLILLCNLFACDQSNQKAPSTPVTDPIQKETITISEQVPPEIAPGLLEQSLIAAGLVDIQSLDSTILVDLKYSTNDNFVGVDVYGDLSRCYLQPEVADKVLQAQTFLTKLQPGWHLLIYDGARPLSVQQILWDTLAKPENIKHLYVANPREGSIHNYGSAVDLTIADEQGQPLDMGTAYDFFGELAYPSKEEELLAQGILTALQVSNRKLLRDIMGRAGLTPINTEWWHFNAYSRKNAAERFEVIN